MKILQNLPNNAKVEAKPAKGGSKSTSKGDSEAKSSSPVSRGDKVEVSGVGQQIKSLRAEMDGISDVRMDKIEAMKGKLADGYHPPAEDVADAIIDTVRQYS